MLRAISRHVTASGSAGFKVPPLADVGFDATVPELYGEVNASTYQRPAGGAGPSAGRRVEHAPDVLTEEQVAAYVEDGCCVQHGALGPAEVEELRCLTPR